MSRQRPLQNESTACGQKLKQQGKMRSGTPEHLLRLAIWLRERPNICYKIARTFRARPNTYYTLQQHFGRARSQIARCNNIFGLPKAWRATQER